MKWHCIEPGHHASDGDWHIVRREEHSGFECTGWWWNPFAPGEDREGVAEDSFRLLEEAKEYAEKRALELGVPYQWGKDSDGSGDWWTVQTPFLFQIKKEGNGCYRLIYYNDDNKEVGVFPTVKQAKEAAEKYVPEVV